MKNSTRRAAGPCSVLMAGAKGRVMIELPAAIWLATAARQDVLMAEIDLAELYSLGHSPHIIAHREDTLPSILSNAM